MPPLRPAAAALALGLALATLAGAAGAQSLALKGGTTGIGAELGYGLSERVGLRANAFGGSLSREVTESGVDYDGKVKMANGALLVDLHPFAGTFRLTAGVAFNNNKFEARAVPQAGTTIEINGIDYDATQVGRLDADIKFEKTAPYLGFGWGTRPQATSGLFFSFDVGAFLAKPTARLNGTCGAALPALVCTQLQADIAAEQVQLQDSVDDLKAWPVVSFGLGWRF